MAVFPRLMGMASVVWLVVSQVGVGRRTGGVGVHCLTGHLTQSSLASLEMKKYHLYFDQLGGGCYDANVVR